MMWSDPGTGDRTGISSQVIPPAVLEQAAEAAPRRVVLDVPFVPQAPGGAWDDPVLADGCEEASALMAVSWARQQPVDAGTVASSIYGAASYEQFRFGTHVDTSAADTAALIRDYLGHPNVSVRYDVGTAELRGALRRGSALVVPVDGTVLANPNYRGAVPRHMIVLRGYDDDLGTFLVNDPGTAQGAGITYSVATVGAALRDYRTGEHLPVTERKTAMVEVSR